MKKRFKKIMCIALSAIMLTGLCACSKPGDSGEGNGGSNGGGSKKNPNAALAKECVYKEQKLDLGLGDDFRVFNSANIDNQIYILGSSYSYDEETGNSDNKLVLCSVDENGKLIEKQTIEFPAMEVESFVPEELLSKLKRDEKGNIISGSNEEDGYYVWQNNSVGNGLITKDGNIIAIRNCYFEYSSMNGYDYVSEDSNYLSYQNMAVDTWDLKGNLLSEVPFDISAYQNDDSYSYVQRLVITKDGSAALMLSGDQTGIIKIGKDGTVSDFIPYKADKINMDNLNGFVPKGDGTALITYYDQETWSKMYVNTMDLETGAMGEAKELPTQMTYRGLYDIYTTPTADFIYSSTDGVYSYKIADGEPKKVMDFINSDVMTTNFSDIIVLDDTHFIASYYDRTDYHEMVSLFSYVKPEDVVEKQVIVLGGLYLNDNIISMVVDFNKSNDTYRVTIRDYSVYNTEENYQAGYTQLNNDIIAGNCPDIINIDDANMPLASYVKKGLLVNIDEMINKDEELSKLEYLQNVFDAYRMDGKLYRVVSDFSVMTFAAKTSLIGDRTSITMDELKELMARLPQGTATYSDSTKNSIVNWALAFNGNDLCNLNTGECKFDTQYFKDILVFANTFPDEMNYDYSDDYWQNYESQFRENKTVFGVQYLSDFSNYKRLIYGTFGEDISYVGFPCLQAQSAAITPNYGSSFAIYAKTANVDGAWAFVRSLLTEEYQNKMVKNRNMDGYPVLKSAFMEMSKDAMEKDYYYDENGKKVYYDGDETYWINGQEIPVKPLTQAQLDKVVNMLTSVNSLMYYNEDIIQIVTEEAAPYFAGQKSVDEVANIIQSRVQMYVNTNM